MSEREIFGILGIRRLTGRYKVLFRVVSLCSVDIGLLNPSRLLRHLRAGIGYRHRHFLKKLICNLDHKLLVL